jgi:UDP-N-acetylmuramoyl-tripeptide--D-alanyl-D-alanine ligase
MKEIASVLRPCVALVTNIGSAHIGIIGSRRAIALEKREIFSRMEEFGHGKHGRHGIAIVPEDCDLGDVLEEAVPAGVEIRQHGEKSQADLKVVENRQLAGWRLSWKGREFDFALPGKHNLANARAAVAIAEAAELADDAIAAGLSRAKSMFGRTEVIEKNGVTIVRDCYNSSPESAAEIIGLCDGLEWAGRRIYVLGAMLELGGEGKSAHEHLGELLARSKADAVFLIGEETQAAFDRLEAVHGGFPFFHTNDIMELKNGLAGCIKPGDLVLLKASRGVGLERVL